MKYFFLLLFSAIISLSWVQLQKHQQFDVYFHKIMIVDSTGKVMTKNWKIGASAEKYTYITSKDTEDVIVTIDSITHFYLFYDPKNLSKSVTIDLPLDAKRPERRFNVNYEYNLYVQLQKICGPYAGAQTSLVFVKNEPFPRSRDPFCLTGCTINPCDCKICFWGNTNTEEKQTRTWRRLPPVKY